MVNTSDGTKSKGRNSKQNLAFLISQKQNFTRNSFFNVQVFHLGGGVWEVDQMRVVGFF